LKPFCYSLLTLLVFYSCDTPVDQIKINRFEFELTIDRSFSENVLSEDGNLGELVYLQGDKTGDANIRIFVEDRILPLGEQLEEAAALFEKSRILEYTKFTEYHLTNSDGLGQQIVYQPFPENIPDLELYMDVRVFPFGNHYYTFALHCMMDDDKIQKKYDSWMRKLTFAPVQKDGNP
jgi:hypothetical protein